MPDRTIEHIREKIAEANLPDDRKDKLFYLVYELKEELYKIAGEHHDDAVHIAKHAEELSLAATDENGVDPEKVDVSAAELRDAVGDFEVTHPQLVKVINGICMMLSNLGI